VHYFSTIQNLRHNEWQVVDLEVVAVVVHHEVVVDLRCLDLQEVHRNQEVVLLPCQDSHLLQGKQQQIGKCHLLVHRLLPGSLLMVECSDRLTELLEDDLLHQTWEVLQEIEETPTQMLVDEITRIPAPWAVAIEEVVPI
jgi:hypothetical protein